MFISDLNSLGLLITTRQESAAVSFVAWIALGLIIGFIGSMLLNRTAHRTFRYVLIGVVGAIVGGFLSNLFGSTSVKGLDIYSLGVAIVGSAVFMFVYHAMFRQRHFLDMT